MTETQSDHINIAVLGDVHGHLTLLYRLLARWERENQEKVDLILQVGDLGAFPPPFRLDKATLRFAEKDPDELGFAGYYEGCEEADEILGADAPAHRKISADLIFIRGNHEDFEFLHSLEEPLGGGPIPVDCYQRIFYLRNGVRYTYQKGSHFVSIIGLGGISDDGEPGRDSISKYYTKSEIRQLRKQGAGVDIFLSHEPPYGAAGHIHPRYQQAGAPAVLEFIRDFSPRYHFCGHYHEPGQALHSPGRTQSYILNEVNFLNPHCLNRGCIGMLRWSGREPISFTILDAPWLWEYNRSNYRLL